MEGQEELLEVPKANMEVGGARSDAKIPLYSPTQIAVGAYLGGPLAGIYLLHANFKALSKDGAARSVLIGGALFMMVLLAVLPFMPHQFPSYVIPISYTLAARGIANGYQMKKPDIATSDKYSFESNWKVTAASILGLLILIVLVFSEMMLLIVAKRGT